jgi:hypothetical protein
MDTFNHEATEAIAHWTALAEAQDRWAVYEEGRGQYGGVARNKAALYRRTAEAIRLTAATGVWHCTCCHKPRCAQKPEGRRG